MLVHVCVEEMCVCFWVSLGQGGVNMLLNVNLEPFLLDQSPSESEWLRHTSQGRDNCC